MKERLLEAERAVVTHNKSSGVAQPTDGAFDDPAPFVPPRGTAVLGGRPRSVLVVRSEHLDSSFRRPLSQRFAPSDLRLAPFTSPIPVLVKTTAINSVHSTGFCNGF
jgi:hypothetical protein